MKQNDSLTGEKRMAINSWENSTEEAIKTFTELINTPRLRSIHFEFEAAIGVIPVVRYSIERFSVPKGEEDD